MIGLVLTLGECGWDKSAAFDEGDTAGVAFGEEGDVAVDLEDNGEGFGSDLGEDPGADGGFPEPAVSWPECQYHVLVLVRPEVAGDILVFVERETQKAGEGETFGDGPAAAWYGIGVLGSLPAGGDEGPSVVAKCCGEPVRAPRGHDMDLGGQEPLIVNLRDCVREAGPETR